MLTVKTIEVKEIWCVQSMKLSSITFVLIVVVVWVRGGELGLKRCSGKTEGARHREGRKTKNVYLDISLGLLLTLTGFTHLNYLKSSCFLFYLTNSQV